MIRAAILAAGNSARAGGVKALFELDGESFLARLVRVFREAAVEDVAVVVGGPHADVIRAAAESLGATIVENRDPSEGPISSVRAAVAALQDPPESSDRLI
ncbi:MAG: NTP transferase domain-containing protein, partial [Planctomycetota bacterium]